jgi:hypothetical protein
MWTMGILTFIGVIFLILKLSPKIRRRIIGHNGMSDVGMTVGFVLLFITTGTISGMMAGIVAGVALSVVLYLAKKLFKHEVFDFKSKTWTQREPEWYTPGANAWPCDKPVRGPGKWQPPRVDWPPVRAYLIHALKWFIGIAALYTIIINTIAIAIGG